MYFSGHPLYSSGLYLILIGLLLLAPSLPFVKKWLTKLKNKDDKGLIKSIEKKIEKVEQKINAWLTKGSKKSKNKKTSETPVND